MTEELIISLKNVKFWAFHGVFPEEKVLGNWFIVQLEVVLFNQNEIQQLEETVDYGQLYSLLKEEMDLAVPLLEELAERIVQKCLARFSQISEVRIEIEKFRPAIGLIDGNSSIRLQKKR